MTSEAFVKAVESYYGQYPRPAVRATVGKYLKDWNEDQLDVMFRNLLLTYSGQYKHVPDVAVLENVRREIAATTSWGMIGKYEGKRLEDHSDFTSQDPEIAPVVKGLLAGIRQRLEARR